MNASSKNSLLKFDLIIAGGGLVGASLAYALRNTHLRIALLDSAPIQSQQRSQPHYDDRVLALSYGSQRILAALGIGSEVQKLATAIKHIHISDRGHFGMTRLNAEQLGTEALGYVLEAKILGETLHRAIDEQANLTVLSPVQFKAVQQYDDHVEFTLNSLEGEQRLQAQLLLAADGGQSWVREHLGIRCAQRDYQQTAIICTVTPARPQKNWAYERFTDSGPLALLPIRGGHYSLVWTVRPEQVEELLSLDDAGFLQRLQARFGWRVGRFVRCGERSAFPLALTEAKEAIRPRIALLGNAAHTLHPVAGQGLNLGLRDVAVLAELLAQAAAEQADLGSAKVLQAYAEARLPDQQKTIDLTDSLVRLFTTPMLPVILGRNLGLAALNQCSPARRSLMRHLAGLGESGSRRLSVGLPL